MAAKWNIKGLLENTKNLYYPMLVIGQVIVFFISIFYLSVLKKQCSQMFIIRATKSLVNKFVNELVGIGLFERNFRVSLQHYLKVSSYVTGLRSIVPLKSIQ